ncbi:hypothetical protein [Jannaschia aquimarina]|uniref:D-galactarate dehydratase n=1 Tax=Jannaschia aquimarina TaxID=935700 RepID=A0A0D1CI51_9RHOB|nr:hypothetical protein [Jannaschia aquimarina]KIT14332.1 hypothetical protein jaqu_39220 [Jannaschia aquimarina]SNS86325.1 hypothetical protein SAMN05421775_10355 [Jannaschia aquimarina]
MRTQIATISTVILLAGCGNIPFLNRDAPAPAPAPRPATVETIPAPGPVVRSPVSPPRAVTSTVGALDTVSDAEKEEAREAARTSSGGALGSATVALGDPADAGLWVKTDLVSSETAGTVTAADGTSVAVTLRPLGGAGGAQISLSALQALGLPLAGLHPVTLAGAS